MIEKLLHNITIHTMTFIMELYSIYIFFVISNSLDEKILRMQWIKISISHLLSVKMITNNDMFL